MADYRTAINYSLVPEQNDNDFSIEFEFSELIRTLTPTEEAEEISLPGLHLNRPAKNPRPPVPGVLGYPVTPDDKTSDNKSATGSGQASGASGNSGDNDASHSGGATGSGTSPGSGSGNNGRDQEEDNKPPAKLTAQCEGSTIKSNIYLYICKHQRILCPDCDGEILRHQSDMHKNECPASAIAHHSPPLPDYSSYNRYYRYPHYPRYFTDSSDQSESSDPSESSDLIVSADSSDSSNSSDSGLFRCIEPDYAGSDPDTCDGDFHYCDYGKKAILRKKKHKRLYIWNTSDFYRNTYFYALRGYEMKCFIKCKEIKVVNYSHRSDAGVILKFCFKVREYHGHLAVSYNHLNPDTKECKPGCSHHIKVVKVGLYSRTGVFKHERCFRFNRTQFYKVSDKEFLHVADIPEWLLPMGELVFYTKFYYY